MVVMALGLIAAFNVMVVRFLWQANFTLETQYLLAVFAVQAIHQVLPGHTLLDPVLEGIQHQIVVVQVARLDELQARVLGCHFIGLIVDAVHQNASEQKIGEHHDPLEPQLGALFQSRHDQREGNARIGRFRPAKAQAFPQHAGDFGDVAVGVGVRGTATDNYQQGFMRSDLALLCISPLHRFAHPFTGRTDHLVIDPQLAAVMHLDAMLRAIGVEDGGNIVLGVTRGEQHTRHG